MSDSLHLLGAIAFLILWCLAGWLAGRFIGRAQHLKRTTKWDGRFSIETERFLTLVAFLALVVGASEIAGYVLLSGSIKICAIVGTIVCVVMSFRRVITTRRCDE